MLFQFENHSLGLLTLDHRPAGGQLQEVPTYTCSHCQAVVVMNPERTRERYVCKGCTHMICDNCASVRAAGAKCRTFSQIADEALEAAARGFDPSSIIIASR